MRSPYIYFPVFNFKNLNRYLLSEPIFVKISSTHSFFASADFFLISRKLPVLKNFEFIVKT
jgi:hypothetical protein